jgi:hypothetical protein
MKRGGRFLDRHSNGGFERHFSHLFERHTLELPASATARWITGKHKAAAPEKGA